MASSKALDPEVTRRLRALAKRIVDEEFKGNTTAAAKAMDVSQPTLWDFIDGKKGKGAGGKVLVGLIKHAPVDALSILGGAVSQPGDTLAMAKEAVRKLEQRDGIPRGEAWILIDDVRLERKASALEFYDAALRLRETQRAREAARPRLHTPPPLHDESIVGGVRGVGVEVPRKNEPQRPKHPRRRAASKSD